MHPGFLAKDMQHCWVLYVQTIQTRQFRTCPCWSVPRVSKRHSPKNEVADMRVEEKRVGSPGEGLGPPVEVFVARGLGEFSAVLVLQVLGMCGMLHFSVVDPGDADSDCKAKSNRQNSRRG